MPDARVQGAITDGASLCLVRLEPPVDDVELEVRRWKKDERALWSKPTNIRVFGGLKGTENFDGNGEGIPPPLPLPRPGTIPHQLSDGATTSSSMAFFVPPDDYLTAGDYGPDFYLSDSTAMNPGEETEITFTIYANGESWPIMRSAFQLRRPPIVLVHGLKGAARNYWGTTYREYDNVPLPTRVYYADYGDTSVLGFDVNYRFVPLAIQAALDDYRGSIDNIGPLFGQHHFTRGFHGVQYAATRADVVGHSMGGVLTRFYVSGISVSGPRLRPPDNGGEWRTTRWDDIAAMRDNNDQEGRWYYLRGSNFWAGDIRRFISMGAPFRGSPIATYGESLAATLHFHPGSFCSLE